MLFDQVLPTSSTFLPQSPSLHDLPSVKVLGATTCHPKNNFPLDFVYAYIQLT